MVKAAPTKPRVSGLRGSKRDLGAPTSRDCRSHATGKPGNAEIKEWSVRQNDTLLQCHLFFLSLVFLFSWRCDLTAGNRTMRRTSILVLFGLSFLLSGNLVYGAPPQTQSSTSATGATIKEELLFEVDPAMEIVKDSERVSSDGKHVALKAKSKGKAVIILDGKPGPEYDAVGMPALNSKGDRLAYPAKQAKKWVLILEEKEQGPEFDDMGSTHFSPDGQRVTCRGRRSELWWVPGSHDSIEQRRIHEKTQGSSKCAMDHNGIMPLFYCCRLQAERTAADCKIC
jgi:hypothetical protein